MGHKTQPMNQPTININHTIHNSMNGMLIYYRSITKNILNKSLKTDVKTKSCKISKRKVSPCILIGGEF